MLQADLFDAPRPDVEITERILRAPKIDLHRHLLGSLTGKCVFELCAKHGLSPPGRSPEEVSALITITTPVEGLRPFFRPWSTLSKLMVSPRIVEEIAYLSIKQASEDRVVYAEFRSSWGMTTNSPFSVCDYLEAVSAGFARGEEEFGTFGRLVLGITRHVFSTHIPAIRRSLWSRILTAAAKHRESLVVGVDIFGVEPGYPAAFFAAEIAHARAEGYGITVHSGEAAAASEVREVIEQLNPSRIGHGLSAASDRDTMDLLLHSGVAIEACPTSNWLTRTVSDLREHPLITLHEHGIKVTINTDNPGVCDTSLSREQAIVIQHMGFTEETIGGFTQNAIDCMFAKTALRDLVTEKWFRT